VLLGKERSRVYKGFYYCHPRKRTKTSLLKQSGDDAFIKKKLDEKNKSKISGEILNSQKQSFWDAKIQDFCIQKKIFL